MPTELRVPAGSAPTPAVYSERDARGNTRLCVHNSHVGEHDFGE